MSEEVPLDEDIRLLGAFFRHALQVGVNQVIAHRVASFQVVCSGSRLSR
jgi:hypothetical protein